MTLKTTHPYALSRLLTEELYCLEETVAGSVPLADAQPVLSEKQVFDYLGENNKYLLILIDEPGESYIQKENLADLEKILKAMGLEVRDTAILNLANFPQAGFEQLKDFFACSKIVLFGIHPDRLKLENFPVNQIAAHQGVKILLTYSFAEMQNDRAKKALFWNEMKKI